MADEGPLIALVGSAIPRDDEGSRVADAALEAKIRGACKALGRALAAAGCRLIVYSSDPFFIESDVVAGYAEIAAKTSGCIRFMRPENDHRNFAEQDDDRTRRLFHVQRDGSADWEASFYQSLQQADGVMLVCGGSSTLIAGHVAMILERPISPIGAFGGMARKLRNHLLHVHPDLPQSEQQALSEFDSGEAAASIVAGLKRRCEEVAASRRLRDEEVQQLKAAQQQLAQLHNAARVERHVRWAMVGFAVASLGLLAIGRDVNPSGAAAVAVFMALLAAGGGLGACLRMTRVPSAGNPSTAMVVGAIAGAVFSLSYMVPHWMSNQASNQTDPFTLGTTPSASVQLVMTWLVALGGGLAADAVIDSLRRGGEQRAQNPNPDPSSTGPAADAPETAVAPGGRKKGGRKKNAGGS